MTRRLMQGRPPPWWMTHRERFAAVVWVVAMLAMGALYVWGGILEDRAYRAETPAQREAHIQGAGGR